MNEVTTRQSTDVGMAPPKNVFEAYAEAASQNKIVGDLLKFSKGEYLSGQDGVEVEEGTELVANMDELMIGWVRWEGGKPTDMKMGKVVDAFMPPPRRELGDTDEAEWELDETTRQPRDPWQLTNYLIMKETGGEKLFTFASSSKGGLGAIAKLAGAYGKNMRQKPNDFPVVALNVDSYRHPNKAYGKIFTPKFDVVGWAPKSEFADALEAAAVEQAAEDKAASELDEGGQGKAPAAKTRF
jgi:hypothetical protein